MRSSAISILSGLGGALIVAGSAHAGFIGLAAISKPNPYALTFNIYAAFDPRPGDFVFAVAGTPLHPLTIEVQGGTFYQHPAGNNLPPSSLLFEKFPSLEFDTFLTIGSKTGDGGPAILVIDPIVFGPSSLELESNGWYITPDNPHGAPDANGRVLLAQLSTQEGTGFSGTMLVAGFSNGISFQQEVSFDTQTPAPGAAALLAAAALTGGRKRRPAKGQPGLLSARGDLVRSSSGP